jgi:K+-transporting ATPase ATPase C chain
MTAHLRACVWLLVLTVVVCCVLYPLALWGIGRAAFPAQAEGSLVASPDGKTIVGSRLIAQAFSGEQYFQPRPSAVSYNAAASGASNWGASNPLLRDRVARQLGTIARHAAGPKAGQPVGPDVEEWFRETPDRVARWAQDFPTSAAAWVKSDPAAADYVKQWAASHPDVPRAWRGKNPDAAGEPAPEDLAVDFFTSFATANPGKFPAVVDRQVRMVSGGPDVQAAFFESWLRANPGVQLQPVPGDIVTASGSGLDPDITRENALYQLPDVARARAKRAIPNLDALPPDRQVEAGAGVAGKIEALIDRLASRPMAGLVGTVRIVNVLELNQELDRLQLP